MSAHKFFDQADVEKLLAGFMQLAESSLFPVGCPPRPTTAALVANGALETSLGTPLTALAFKEVPIHVPVGIGENARHSYKSELVFVRDPGVRTVKMLWWHDRDPRSEPHCHPWNFRSAILHGGYDEVRFWIDERGKVQSEERTYEAGEINVMPANVFHCVTAVRPGTVTLLDCGPAAAGNAWGYLDTESGRYIDQKELAVPDFGTNFVAINPHRAKK